ncbi:MAG: SGNH/GDSL hydrolase family protein [Synechococcus sp.]|nr:SGNH/GDSL hydrolase family protein [Synechococcus sp.]
MARREPKTILCFGDSNTWGFDPESGGRHPFDIRWPNQLAAQLSQRNQDQPWRAIEEGLNARTWLMDDPIGAVAFGAEYSCSGRAMLTTALHSHKPLDVVVLALGCNDIKGYLNLGPNQIGAGARILIHDVLKASGCGPADNPEQPPMIVLMAPSAVMLTPQARDFGFVNGATQAAKEVADNYQKIAGELNIKYFNVQKIASPSPADGVHFGRESQALIASELSICIDPLP